MEFTITLDGEAEHAAEVVEAALAEANPDADVDLEEQAEQVVKQHILQQYQELVMSDGGT